MMREETMKCLLVNFLKGTNAVIKKAKTKNMLSYPLVEVISAGGMGINVLDFQYIKESCRY